MFMEILQQILKIDLILQIMSRNAMLFIGRYEKVIRLIKVIISWKNNDQIFWAYTFFFNQQLRFWDYVRVV